jgi:4-amino-4-deoxy-L-arabinose transferase-like glycosyltransferase
MTTDVTPAPRREATAAEPTPDRTGSVIVAILALGWLAGVLWRLWLGNPITHPIAHTDEDSYMNAARAIAGGPEGFSSETPLFRRIGYPLLVSPAFLFGLDFATSYKIVHVVNALISALTLPLAYLLGRRMFGMTPWIALAAAFAAATIPAGVFWSLVGMTDSIMAPLMLGWFLAIHRWLGDTARKGAAVTAGLVTGVLYTVHIRGTILLVVYLAFLAFLVFRRLAGVRAAALTLVPVTAMMVLNQVVIMLVGDRVHLRGDIVGGGTLAVFTDGQRLQVFIAAVGTNVWYLCVVTAGLAGLAWVATTVEMFRPARDAAFRWTAGVALFSTIGTALGAALILAGLVGLPADAIYSRYVQVFVPFWLLFGFAVLADARLRVLVKYAIVPVLALTVGGAIIAFRLRYVAEQGHRLGYGLFGGPDIITITAGWKQFRPLVGTAIGLTGLAVLLAVTRLRGLMIPVLALVVALNGVTMAIMRDRLIEPIAARYTLPIDLPALGVGPGDTIGFTDDMTHEGYFVLYHDVYWTELTRLADDTDPGVDVVVGRYYPGVPYHWDGTRYGYELLGASQADGQVGIWRRR